MASVCSSSDELREYFGQFGSVKKCLLPFVSSRSLQLFALKIILCVFSC